MNINKSYKVEINPNNKQRTLLLQHAGAARFAYNWGLARKIEEYKTAKKSSSAIDQHKQLVQLKRTPEYVWLYTISKCAPQEALRDLEKAYQNFFRRVKNGETPGFPKFKSRRKGIGSFRLMGDIKIYSNKVRLPKIGIIRLKEKNYIPINAKFSSITCSEKSGHWFISISCKEEILETSKGTGTIGIDLGIKQLATLSDKRIFDNPKFLNKNLKKLARLQRRLSRQQKGSNNRNKTKEKISKLYYKISNMRNDRIHKITSSIIKVKTKPKMIVLEDLSVSKMLKNKYLSRSISDASFNEFRRQIEYKSNWYGVDVLIAHRYFPSSKLCNNCGNINEELKLSDRTWTCKSCNTLLDRDLNAAINLANLTTVSSTESNACGQCNSTWMNQELNTNFNLLELDKF